MALKESTNPVDDDSRLALLAFLHDRDEPCPSCRYNLRNLTSTFCPECGVALRVGVQLAEPYLGAWISLLVALFPPATLGSIYIGIFVYILINVPRDINLHGVPVSVVLIFTHMVLSLPLVVLAIAMRRKFTRLPRGRQRLLSTLAWCWWVLTGICIKVASMQ